MCFFIWQLHLEIVYETLNKKYQHLCVSIVNQKFDRNFLDKGQEISHCMAFPICFSNLQSGAMTSSSPIFINAYNLSLITLMKDGTGKDRILSFEYMCYSNESFVFFTLSTQSLIGKSNSSYKTFSFKFDCKKPFPNLLVRFF